MRIGSQDVPDTTQGYGPRQQVAQPQIGPQVDTRGLNALANALANTGKLGTDYVALRTREEEERQGYDGLLKKQEFEGVTQRRVNDARQNLPADGAGYADVADKIWQEEYDKFNKSIPDWLKQKFAPDAQSLRQQLLLSADGFTREATRGHSISTIDAAVEDARLEVYKNPGSRAAVGEKIGGMIEAAPGLLPDERTIRAREALERLNGAEFGGTLRGAREAMFAIPFSTDVQRRIVPAIILQESGGREDAESSKGAIGLMQVLPSTAVEIAQDIGDQNFPFKEGRAAWKEYLKSPGVNQVYGTFYFNQLLKKYGGDVELALVGYNAGPGVADKYVASGRNRSVLPEETQGYVDSITKKLGGVTPEMAFDPEFGLTLDQALQGTGQIEAIRGQVEQDVAGYIRGQTEAAAQVHDATLNTLYQRAEGGEEFRPMYMDAVRQGKIQYDRTELEGGIGISNRVLETEHKITEAFTKAATGQPVSASEANYLFPPQMRQGIVEGDAEAVQTAVNRVAKIGFVPPALQQTMTQMLYSQNLEQVGTGAEMYATLQRTNPALVQGLPDDVGVRAASFNALRAARLPSDQLQQVMNVTSTVEGRTTLKQLQTNDDNYKKNLALQPAEIADWFDSWLPLTGDTQAPSEPGQSALLQQQYQALYSSFFATTLDAEMAKDLTLKQLEKTWGPTTTGGQQRLMWLPPEKALASFAWDVNGDGELENVQLSPEQAIQTIDSEVKRNFGLDRYMLLSLPDTETAGQQGKPIPYGVIPLDADGEVSWDLSDPRQLDLLAGRPFTYNYGEILKQNLGGQEEKRMLEDELEGLEQTPANSQRIYQIQNRIQEIEGGLLK